MRERMIGFPTYYPHFMLLLILFFTSHAKGQPVATPAIPPVAAAAPSPGPPPPLNISAVLEKGGQFKTLIRLLKTTQIDERINSQLNNSKAALTLFAPTDNAFSSLPAGTLNGLNDQKQVTLLQFHIVPTLVTISEFQTLSNPISTQAGDPSDGQYPLNVTTVGNQVNITTGLVNATVSGTVYADDRLAVYRVDKVLLPLGIFRPSVPTPPSRGGEKNASETTEGPYSSTGTNSASATSVVVSMWRQRLAIGAAVSFSYWRLSLL